MSHTEERPYQCDICHSSFTRAYHLKVHKMTHTGEKPYECDICQKLFGTASNLKTHKQIHTGEKPYGCGVCHKSFGSAGNLKTHEVTHTGERPYECGVCHKTFGTKGNLKKHEKIHTGERPYVSDITQQTYSESNILTKQTTGGTQKKPCEYNVSSQSSSQTKNIHSEDIDSRKPHDPAPGFPYEFSPKKHNAYIKSRHDLMNPCMNAHVLDKYDNEDTAETLLYTYKAQHMNKSDNEQGNVLVNDFEIAGNDGTFNTEILFNCVQPQRTPMSEIAPDVEHTQQFETQYVE